MAQLRQTPEQNLINISPDETLFEECIPLDNRIDQTPYEGQDRYNRSNSKDFGSEI